MEKESAEVIAEIRSVLKHLPKEAILVTTQILDKLAEMIEDRDRLASKLLQLDSHVVAISHSKNEMEATIDRLADELTNTRVSRDSANDSYERCRGELTICIGEKNILRKENDRLASEIRSLEAARRCDSMEDVGMFESLDDEVERRR